MKQAESELVLMEESHEQKKRFTKEEKRKLSQRQVMYLMVGGTS